MKQKLYLDKRATKKGEPSPLKLSIAHNNGTALLNLGISLLPSQFNAKTERVENHPNKAFLNTFLQQRKNEIEKIVLDLSFERKLAAMTATELKNYIKGILDNQSDPKSKKKLSEVWNEFASKKVKINTLRLYKYSYRHLQKCFPKIDTMLIDNFSVQNLREFDTYLSQTCKQNAKNVIFRCIRAVCNYAVSNEYTTNNPFGKFKFKQMPTQKRSLTVEQLRTLINMPLPIKDIPCRDFFVLTFCLIGINSIDLLTAPLTAISNQNRFDYLRSKTNRPYSIKIEPETQKLLDRYKGQNHLLKFMDKIKFYQNAREKINSALKRMIPTIPNFSLYWARHTWATIAAGLDIPKETIAYALGHGERSLTNVYINFNERKVDIANRKILDYVFYGIEP